MKIKTSLIILLFFQIISLKSQDIINDYYYPFDMDLDGWTSTSIVNTGEWTWSDNGKADDGVNWDTRESINSNSQGGAAVYDGDDIINSSGIPGPYTTALTSEFLDFSGEETVYLKFYQYYRNYQSSTRIEYAEDGADWQELAIINGGINQNVETGPNDYIVLDISDSIDNAPVRIRFVFEGDYYFWILDDIGFYDGYPHDPTFPTYVGDSLASFGYDFEVDDSDWPYVPNEMVVQFQLGVSESIRADIRDSFGVAEVESCACNHLELWRLEDSLVVWDGNELSPIGGTTDIIERVKGVNAKTGIDGADLNRYNYNELKDSIGEMNLELIAKPPGISAAPFGTIRIAIIDTGIDIDHDSLENYIFLNDDEPNNDIDEDENCLVDDIIGWNYIHNNNNPDDDHSHGTHVAGILVNTLEEFGGNNCDYRIIPYKTHDFHGVSNLFDVACATYQSWIDEASVVNDSWGFYGDSSIILSNAVDTLKLDEVLVISAAGNDTINLNDHPQYPACYSAANIISVGALDTFVNMSGSLDTLVLGFSNYDPDCVDILAPGENVLSTIPNEQMGIKSGTSMAAPFVSAAAAMSECIGFANFQATKNQLLDCAWKYPALANKVKDGNVLNLDYPCLTPVEYLLPRATFDFHLFPNPTSSFVVIKNEQGPLSEVSFELYNTTGQAILKHKIDQWMRGEQQQIELENLSLGIYLLKIRYGSYLWTYKILKI